MRKRIRFALIAVIVLGVLATTIYAVYNTVAARARSSMAKSFPRLTRRRRRREAISMLTQITTLHNELQSKGPWSQVFEATFSAANRQDDPDPARESLHAPRRPCDRPAEAGPGTGAD